MDSPPREPTRLPTPAPSDGGHGHSSTPANPICPSLPPTPLPTASSTFYLSPLPLPLPLTHILPKSRSSLSLNFSTSTWDTAQSRFISALPSPSISNAGSMSDFADRDEPPRRQDSSTTAPGGNGSGSKTSSFFSASFAATPPPPPPLALAPQRSVSVSIRGKHADGGQPPTPSAYPYPQRSASAERSDNSNRPNRADSANAIFFAPSHQQGQGNSVTSTPVPPPPLLAQEDLTLTPTPTARRDALGLGLRHSPPKQRKIILLDDEPGSYTTSPEPSPVKPAHAPAQGQGHAQLGPPVYNVYEERPRAASVSMGFVARAGGEKPLPPTPTAAQEAAHAQAGEHHAPHLHREPHTHLTSSVPHEPLIPGAILGSEESHVTLVRALGQGAFSSVWLARDALGTLPLPGDRRKSESFARRRKDRRMAGLSPGPRMPSGGLLRGREREGREGSVVLDEEDGEGGSASASVPPHAGGRLLQVPGEARLVAVKCLDRAMCEANDRTRISFVREVEVLRHISHPSIVSYLHSFTTPTHHCLVLEYLAGGELFSLLDNDDRYGRMTEPLVRRMFGELARAVGWMHGVALVHRDIKLENILLTCDPFSPPSYPSFASLPTPLLKLSDFGLSRFIDPSSPLLQTRCGSESYAAPEIVMGQKYDGRQTDAWACGVVLYALATRVLPFDAGGGEGQMGNTAAQGREGRKALLFRIAKGDYTWPKDPRPFAAEVDAVNANQSQSQSQNENQDQDQNQNQDQDSDMDSPPPSPSPGPLNLATPGLKRVVARLLVRDPSKRAKVIDLWDEEWMQGPGAPPPPHRDTAAALVDGDSIGEVARTEVV